MAYVPVLDTRRRAATLTAVALVHGAAAVLILSGFAGGAIHTATTHIKAQFWPQEVPPPAPTPVPSAAASRTAVSPPRPQPLVKPPTLPIVEPDVLLPLTPPSLPTGGGLGIDPAPATPSPSPSARFVPQGARPLGAPGRWVTDNDYPSGAMRRGEQGVTGFAVTVGPDGRVRDCTVIRSSGSPDLDRAACARVSERARFAPATDANGNPAAGRYTNSIRWQIPTG